MRFRVTPDDEWRRGFALFPLRIGDVRVWLERFEYRPHPSIHCNSEYEYRLIG